MGRELYSPGRAEAGPLPHRMAPAPLPGGPSPGFRRLPGARGGNWHYPFHSTSVARFDMRSLTRLTSSLALSLPLLLTAACGGSNDPDALLSRGYERLQSENYRGALEVFEQAVASLEPQDERWKEAQLAAIEARMRLDANRAKEDFLALAREHQAKFLPRDFAGVGNKLAAARATVAAIDVVDAGLKEFGYEDDPQLKQLLALIIQRAESGEDDDALAALRSLGYL